MISVLLAFIGALIVMAILSIGRFAFGRREAFVARKFIRWFIGYFIFNFIVCFLIVYGTEPALTGPFGGWQWLLWPLVLSSIGNLFSFVRPALGTLGDLSAASQGRRSSANPASLPVTAPPSPIPPTLFLPSVPLFIRI